MTTELATIDGPSTSLSEQMSYARAVSTASMLPDNYRGKPADIMLAVGLGQSMGLSPAESLYRISVIKGKPTASAELIAANVRKAGHRLRVRGDETTCTATIIRADDPDYEFTVVRDLAWARQMGLADQPNYRKQPGTMLQWRAITAVARLACPEALYGVSYTPDEIGDSPQQRTGGLAAALADESAPVTVTAEQVHDEPDGPAMLDTRSSLAKAMFAAMREAGIDDKDDRLALCSDVTGREITSSTDLLEAEARAILDHLSAPTPTDAP
ncbi:MAG: hypothetical protein HOQ18_18370 [Dermatophilaceae bacterium]|nr:hypothetical protein [Dermatophilaceae bacterium]NUO92767.1 hypothetical protein [Dermatophilaceae bacterium]NUR16692.1 hypothetical protein [Dermatophilaceae bacterium]